MSDQDKPSLAEKVIDFIDEAQREAVKAERERYVASVTAVIAATTHPECVHCAALRNCRDAIAGSAPEPPPPEPGISTSGIMTKLRECAYPDVPWPEVEKDIGLLVEAERQRAAGVLTAAIDVALRTGHAASANILTRCRDDILSPPSEPPTSPPEPMTIATMIAKLSAVSNQNWHTIRADLEELVKGQARRDAELVQDRLLPPLGEATATAILKSAGLE